MQKFNLTLKNNNGVEVLILNKSQFDILSTLTNDIKLGMITNIRQVISVTDSLTNQDKTLQFLKVLKITLRKGAFKDELINKINYLEGGL